MKFTVRKIEWNVVGNVTHECHPVCLQREWRWGVWRTRPTGRPKPTEWWVDHNQHSFISVLDFQWQPQRSSVSGRWTLCVDRWWYFIISSAGILQSDWAPGIVLLPWIQFSRPLTQVLSMSLHVGHFERCWFEETLSSVWSLSPLNTQSRLSDSLLVFQDEDLKWVEENIPSSMADV